MSQQLDFDTQAALLCMRGEISITLDHLRKLAQDPKVPNDDRIFEASESSTAVLYFIDKLLDGDAPAKLEFQKRRADLKLIKGGYTVPDAKAST